MQAAIQSLTAEVATLKALLQDVLPNVLPANNDNKVAEKVAEQAVETPLATLEPCELHSHAARRHENVALKREDKVNENKVDEHKANDDKLNENRKELSFPNELKPHEKNAICKALEAENIKDKSTCQLLLDDLSSRFSISDWQPIRSPIGYFKSLIRNYKQGSFDDSYVEDFRSKQKAAETAQKEAQSTTERRAYLDKYNDAKNKYENLKMAAQSLGRTLRDIAKDRGWTTLIEEMGFDLDVAIPT